MDEKSKKELDYLNELMKNDKLVFITLGIPVNRLEEFIRKLKSTGMNIHIKIPNYKKQKTAEMLMLNKERDKIQ